MRNIHAVVRAHHARRPIDLVGAVAKVQLDAVRFVPRPLGEHEFFRIAVREKRGEPHPVIGGTRLLAKRDETVLLRGIVFDELLAKSLPTSLGSTSIYQFWKGFIEFYSAGGEGEAEVN